MEQNNSHIGVIVLSILLVIVIGVAAFLYFNLNGKITSLESQLAAQSGSGAGGDGNAQLSRDLESLQQLIKAYLQEEGRTCTGDVKTCLNDLMQTASSQGGPDCSLVRDGVCSAWCAANKDYDCCIEAGFQWQSGVGCRTDFPK